MEQQTKTDMSTLLTCMKKAKEEGYKLSFSVTDQGLTKADEEGSRFYTPEETSIDNFYRFEGESDPSENSILYLIHTVDGEKGTLLNTYGMYADPLISPFIEQVEEISKKVKPE
jgi:hypothetical protein